MKYEVLDHITHASSLSNLINRAYRGTEGTMRWTTEHHLVAGDRISTAAVEYLINDPAVLFIAGFENEEPVCCITVTQRDSVNELGTFAVAPELQGQGVGAALMRYAEALTGLKNKPFEVSVVNRNKALIEFYHRRGYLNTGKTRPYPVESNVGIPKTDDLCLIVLTRPV